MPYYLYRVSQIGPIRQIEKLAEYEKFKPASVAAKEMRMNATSQDEIFRVVFGENELQAEDTLNTPREVQPVFGDEW